MKKTLFILATVARLHTGKMAIDGYMGLTW